MRRHFFAPMTDRIRFGVMWLLRVWSPLCLATAIGADTNVVFEAEVSIPMRDGIRLSANIFKPTGAGPWPVLLGRTPYGKGDEKGAGGRSNAAKGYVTVIQDCRGRGNSEGVWEPFRDDAADGFDTVEWIGRQPWCTGRVATFGGSYGGWTHWALAPNSSRFLRAMVPLVPFGNTYENVAYSGGALMLGLTMGWGEAVGGVGFGPDQVRKSYFHLPLQTFTSQFPKEVPYIRDWVRHPTYDAFWKARGIDHRDAEVTVPSLNIGGWYDIFSKETLELASGVRKHSRSAFARTNQFVIMGPWGHGLGTRKLSELDFGPEAALKMSQRQDDWYDYWLRDRDHGIAQWPPYYLFVMGENRWRGEREWPLNRTRFTPYYLGGNGHANSLHGDGVLSLDRPLRNEKSQDRFVYDGNYPVPTKGGNNLVGATAGPEDQTQVEERDDVLVYTTPVLTADLEVTGPIKLILWAASSARDTDFTGKLVDVHPDGKAYNICEGIQRARYRQGLDRERPLVPGRAEPFEIDLWVTSNVFLRGHRVRLEVSSSNFPRFDRNPNSGKPFGSDTVLLPATQTILHDREHPSHLVLPVIPR